MNYKICLQHDNINHYININKELINKSEKLIYYFTNNGERSEYLNNVIIDIKKEMINLKMFMFIINILIEYKDINDQIIDMKFNDLCELLFIVHYLHIDDIMEPIKNKINLILENKINNTLNDSFKDIFHWEENQG